MPKVFSWAVNQIGVERAFKDCTKTRTAPRYKKWRMIELLRHVL